MRQGTDLLFGTAKGVAAGVQGAGGRSSAAMNLGNLIALVFLLFVVVAVCVVAGLVRACLAEQAHHRRHAEAGGFVDPAQQQAFEKKRNAAVAGVALLAASAGMVLLFLFYAKFGVLGGNDDRGDALLANLGLGLGGIGLCLGVTIGTMGYKLWKYVIFTLGFLQGAAIGFLLSFGSHQDLVLCLFVSIFCGIMGGGFYLACYFVVIFCAGCQCGVATFVLLAVAFSYNIDVTWAIDNMGRVSESASSALLVGGLIFGILGGCLFVKLQKLCIILGTSFLGAGMVCLSLFQGFAEAGYSDGQLFLQLALFVGFFCVQWFKTSKGVEIDPQTGQVTVIIVQPPMQPTIQAPLLGQPQAAWGGGGGGDAALTMPRSSIDMSFMQRQQQQPPQQIYELPPATAPQQDQKVVMATATPAPAHHEQPIVSDAVGLSRPASPAAAETGPGATPLDDFLSTNKLEKHRPALDELVSSPQAICRRCL